VAAVLVFVDRPPAHVTRFLAGRVLAGLITLVIFVTILFFLAEVIIPGDFVTQFTLGMNSEQLAELRAQLGIDRPLLERYFEYMAGLARGDLGDSAAGGSVADVLKAVLPWTLLIFTYAIAIAFPIGHWLGKVAGWRSGEKGSAGLSIASVGLYTIFPPLLVFFLVVGVSGLTDNQGIGRLRALFNGGDLTQDTAWFMVWTLAGFALLLGFTGLVLARSGRAIPRLVWALALILGPVGLWLATGRWDEVSNILIYLALPIAAVAILAAGEVVLVSKSTTAEAAQEDFVFTARAKGVPDRQIRDHHVARYALLPTLSKLMVSVPFILVGLMIIEISFAWPKDGAFGMTVPGLSSSLFFSLESRDTTVVVGGLLAVGLIVFGTRMLLDVAYAALDPRIRVGGKPP
jgi:peptide/nickel transport system permease protein